MPPLRGDAPNRAARNRRRCRPTRAGETRRHHVESNGVDVVDAPPAMACAASSPGRTHRSQRGGQPLVGGAFVPAGVSVHDPYQGAAASDGMWPQVRRFARRRAGRSTPCGSSGTPDRLRPDSSGAHPHVAPSVRARPPRSRNARPSASGGRRRSAPSPTLGRHRPGIACRLVPSTSAPLGSVRPAHRRSPPGRCRPNGSLATRDVERGGSRRFRASTPGDLRFDSGGNPRTRRLPGATAQHRGRGPRIAAGPPVEQPRPTDSAGGHHRFCDPSRLGPSSSLRRQSRCPTALRVLQRRTRTCQHACALTGVLAGRAGASW